MDIPFELVYLTLVTALTIGLMLWFALYFVPSVIEDLRRNRQ